MRKTGKWALAALLTLACASAVQAERPVAGESVGERQQRRREAFEAAIVKQDFDKALTVLDEMIGDKEVADDERAEAYRFQFRIFIQEKNDGAKACAAAKKLSELKKDDALLLNELAWLILDAENLKDRDLDLTLAIAVRAADLSKYENGMILDTLARAYYEKKNLDKAIEFQTKAVEKSEKDEEATDDIRDQMKAALEKYKAEKAKKAAKEAKEEKKE